MGQLLVLHEEKGLNVSYAKETSWHPSLWLQSCDVCVAIVLQRVKGKH